MRSSAVIVAVLLAAASTASAQTMRDTVNGQLDAYAESRRADGFAPDTQALGRATMVGLLTDRTSVLIELALDAGREYVIAAGCDTDCDNLDTRVLTPRTFTVLAENVRPDDVPVVDVKPTQTGIHLLAVMMTSCKTELCYFGFVILSRPASAPVR